MSALREKISRRRWVLAYELEDARALAASGHHYLKSAGCCLCLALLRFVEQIA